eukprot:2043134-Alexandrium_andersonii.AAC.1
MDDEDLERQSLQLREDVEILKEYCGISGWNKILMIAKKRDSLRDKGAPHAAQAVAQALACVKWGAGREVTPAVVEKCVVIADRARRSTTAQAWIAR